MATETGAAGVQARYQWVARGDVNAFFGLMLDNVGAMILMASLLVEIFGFPREFVLTKMIPGTAIGVLVGDLIYTVMAFQLARRSGRRDVTAMPLGLDTPSTFGVVFLILGPAFLKGKADGLDAEAAARHAWFLGITMLLASGVFKLVCASLSSAIRRVVPRAGLLGSLASIALVLISFLPLLDIAAAPVAGLVALALILATLTARWELPWRVPGALGGVAIGCVVAYAMQALGWSSGLDGGDGHSASRLQAVVPMPIADWLAWLRGSWEQAAGYLPVAIPLALATVVGGIDCAESAAAAGDDYPTGPIIAAEGFSTLVAGLFGGVIQSTPYIGHPAYKAMGARAGYTLATALFVGSAGVFGYFGWLFHVLPKAVVFPILVFVGLEITAQTFRATPVKHYPALALACVPALAYLARIQVEGVVQDSGKAFEAFSPQIQATLETLVVLSNGFIVTSLLWATWLAKVIDGRMRAAACALGVAAAFALAGIIHSPLPSSPIAPPNHVMRELARQHRLPSAAGQTPYHWAAGYAGMAVVLLALGRWGRAPKPEDHEAPRAV